jgi:hypothetical protein
MVCVYSDPMEGTPEGLADKPFWRKARGEWHSFEKLAEVRGYVSLCQRREIGLVFGQQIARPEAHLRFLIGTKTATAWVDKRVPRA